MVSEWLNMISITATFIAVLTTLYLIQKITIGLLPFFKRILFKSVSLGDPVFILTSIFIIYRYFDFYRPY
ncbi:hypothetical protein D0439_04390 [Lysinibacillus fusiformis]|uniref:hypothetical protein n=1 Tax=Lysinibacillus fusiformis TaxID=28031 RepID=UPI0011BB7649|nr:hypothetical protein [Lysinibacillus fusiformis]QDZ97906.1 hypothetical protein D0439_04390 [Lysinibacillus fusiformis]